MNNSGTYDLLSCARAFRSLAIEQKIQLADLLIHQKSMGYGPDQGSKMFGWYWQRQILEILINPEVVSRRAMETGILYRIAANIDSMFPNAQEALNYFNQTPLIPQIPLTAAEHEDKTIPRVCVAPTLKNCITAISVMGRFRRCLAANTDAKSYETHGLEVYPVIVQYISAREAVDPPKGAVPDLRYTHEKWLMKPTMPLKNELRWLGMRSIIWHYAPKYWLGYTCQDVRWVTPGPNSTHPWLNGKGHLLESSEEEGV